MANEHTLKRILDQIAQHKVTLSRVDPEDEEAEIREAEQIKREPFRKVKSVFSEENLQKRMEENAPPIEESESSTWAESPNPPVEAQVGHPDHDVSWRAFDAYVYGGYYT